jgi:hypothetical protein
MKPCLWRAALLTVLALGLALPLTARPAPAADKIDICSLVSEADLAKLHRKKLYPNPDNNGCYWSLKPKAMAYLHIAIRRPGKPLRKYFNANLPGHVKLVEIKDLGDGGLMSVSEGSLGVVVIKKGGQVLQSAVTFLDIEPGSKKQKALWDIYRRILAKL